VQIRTYPYRAWVLNQLNKPKRVLFTEANNLPSRYDQGDLTKKGKVYALADIFPSKEAALTKAGL
jgi:hypothetical protein